MWTAAARRECIEDAAAAIGAAEPRRSGNRMGIADRTSNRHTKLARLYVVHRVLRNERSEEHGAANNATSRRDVEMLVR